MTEPSSSVRIKLVSLLFGFGSWITITGFWAEVPLLVQRLPEGWRLPSYLSVFIQAANFGPVVYYFCRKYKLCTEVTANHVQLAIGGVCCLLLMTSWDYTIEIGGQHRSVALFVAAFGLSLTDCTSSVTFLPFMARFKETYLTPYLIGEGLSGVIPIIVASIQGVQEDHDGKCSKESSERHQGAEDNKASFGSGKPDTFSTNGTSSSFVPNENNNSAFTNGFPLSSTANFMVTTSPSHEPFATVNGSGGQFDPSSYTEPTAIMANTSNLPLFEPRFSPNVFFLSLLVTLVISWLAFCYLLFSAKAKKEQVNYERAMVHERIELVGQALVGENVDRDGGATAFHAGPEAGGSLDPLSAADQWKYNYLQAIMVFACLSTFGIMPSIQSYSSLPYGSWALHNVVIFSGLAYPVGCFVAMAVETRSMFLINLQTALGTLISLYLIVCALMSPRPPFLASNLTASSDQFRRMQVTGGWVNIVAWVLFVAILSYVKTNVTVILSRMKGEDALFWVGMLTQIGSLLGTIVMYFAVNHTGLFSEGC
ncbi:Riboflavin transporter 2 [Halotydeus destructor]|nr:Riboflavin transporter 2 [Halotydeus destructor]